METWKCDVCDKSFSGIVCFQQHEASEKHRKKMRQVDCCSLDKPKATNLDSTHQIYCSVCMVSILGLENYKKHVNSLDHAIMVQKKENDLLSQSVSSSFELKSEQNHSKESNVSVTSSSRTVAFAECKPCQKQFSGLEPYQQHLSSAGHKKKCGPSNQIWLNGEINSVSIPPYNPQSPASAYNLREQDQSMASNGSFTSITKVTPFIECKPCQKQFSGPEPYQQHLVSAGHKKKCNSQIGQNDETDSIVKNEFVNKFSCNSQSSISSYNISAFKCDICDMTFTGPAPYNQHLVSNGHKKKIIATNWTKQLAATGSPSECNLKEDLGYEQRNMNDFQKWFCDVCKVPCSGPVPYDSHIKGQDHAKKLRALVVEENLQKIKASGSLVFIENNVDSNVSNQIASTLTLQAESKSEIEGSCVEFPENDLNVNNHKTKILSDKFQMNMNDLISVPNLNIIPAEQLDVTVFSPDDEIIFNSPKKIKN